MRTRTTVLVAASIMVAAACTWLGFWQIRRLHEKQEYNAGAASRRFLPAIALGSIPRDTAQSKFRRVLLEGKYDFPNQIIWTLRGRNGSPGVNILTPLRREGTDTAILVNRGWVYSADATNVDLALWNEPDSVSGEGYVLPLHASVPPQTRGQSGRAYRTLDRNALAGAFPYPIAPVFAMLSTVPVDTVRMPPRVMLIPLDDGSHRSYAFQWFSFAAISIIGAIIFTRKT